MFTYKTTKNMMGAIIIQLGLKEDVFCLFYHNGIKLICHSPLSLLMLKNLTSLCHTSAAPSAGSRWKISDTYRSHEIVTVLCTLVSG